MSKADEMKEVTEVLKELDSITPKQLDKAIKEVDKELRLEPYKRI